MPSITIYDTEGQLSWASKTTTTDESGTSISISIAYDNGLVSSDIYANGVRATNIIEDVAVDGGLLTGRTSSPITLWCYEAGPFCIRGKNAIDDDR